MIKILYKKSTNFKNQLDYSLGIRKQISRSKISIVKKIIEDVKKKQDKSLIKYEKKFNKLRNLTKKDLYSLVAK